MLQGPLLFWLAAVILPVVMRHATAEEPRGIHHALQLLGGRGDEVMEGIGLIDAAAATGNPAALERQALFEAIGCGRPQSWDRALDCLEQAAQDGSDAARQQLLVLARTAPPPEADWKAIRAGIRVDDLLAAPAKRALSESPRLRVIDGFASAMECAWLIERARPRLTPAKVVDPAGGQEVRAARTNSGVEFQLVDMDVVLELIRARIAASLRLPLPLFQPTQILHYSPGQEFRPHHDYFDPQVPGHAEQLKLGQRIATFLVYLNDDFAGGATDFPRAHVSFRGKTGDALFLANVERSGRPDPMSLHSGTPPTSGEKWILSQWIRDRAPVAQS